MKKGNGEASKQVDVISEEIKSRAAEAMRVALDLADAADHAAEQMCAEADALQKAVKDGTDRLRADVRNQMTNFATVMQAYSDAIAAKNAAYIEAGRRSIDTMQKNIETVQAALNAAPRTDESRSIPIPQLVEQIEQSVATLKQE
jgi:hypothetical protein